MYRGQKKIVEDSPLRAMRCRAPRLFCLKCTKLILVCIYMCKKGWRKDFLFFVFFFVFGMFDDHVNFVCWEKKRERQKERKRQEIHKITDNYQSCSKTFNNNSVFWKMTQFLIWHFLWDPMTLIIIYLNTQQQQQYDVTFVTIHVQLTQKLWIY